MTRKHSRNIDSAIQSTIVDNAIACVTDANHANNAMILKWYAEIALKSCIGGMSMATAIIACWSANPIDRDKRALSNASAALWPTGILRRL